MIRRLLAVLLIAVAALAADPARAGDLLPPGLENDSQTWQRDLAKAVPAGASDQQRSSADQQAAAALVRKDSEAAITALERRVGMGDAPMGTLLSLGRLYADRTPPDWRKALAAATRARGGLKNSGSAISGYSRPPRPDGCREERGA